MKRFNALVSGEIVTIDMLVAAHGSTCHLCGKDVDLSLKNKDPMMPSFDHKIPISRGGIDSRDNLALAHLACNIRRGNRELTA